jgi:hypothetical protein
MIGVIASVILAAGLIPPYYELAKRGGRVIGISMRSFKGQPIQDAEHILTLFRLHLSYHRLVWSVLFVDGTRYD